MRILPAEVRRGAVALACALVLLGAALTACTSGETDQVPPNTSAAPETTESQLRELLSRRTRAVRKGNLTAFLADVAGDRPGLVRRQRRLFLNLRELPIARYTQAAEGPVTVDEEDRTETVVVTSLQLDGFDAHPVRYPALMSFAPGEEGELVLVDDRDTGFAEENDLEQPPWELTRIEVQRGDGVLGIFDARSADAAYQIIPAVQAGIDEVDRSVPRDWSGRVVVYALSDIRVLAELDGLPGGDPDRLDAVAFPVRAGKEGRKLAGTRFILHPRMIDRDDDVRDRLIRHELTHVALGRLDDRVPTWLSEGIAEYVSVQPVPTYERRIARAAVKVARAGVARLPADSSFNGPRSGANYGISWYACEHIAAVYGEDTLWRLLAAMRTGDGDSYARRDAVLREVLGIGAAELAGAAGRKIVATFG